MNNSKYDLWWEAVVTNQKHDTLSYFAIFVYYTIPSLFTSFEAVSENLQCKLSLKRTIKQEGRGVCANIEIKQTKNCTAFSSPLPILPIQITISFSSVPDLLRRLIKQSSPSEVMFLHKTKQ